MYIYNSMSNKIEKFKSIKEKEVSMYVCGPTVYNYIILEMQDQLLFLIL